MGMLILNVSFPHLNFRYVTNSGTVITAFGKAAPEPTPFLGSALRGVGTLHIHLCLIYLNHSVNASGHGLHSSLQVLLRAK